MKLLVIIAVILIISACFTINFKKEYDEVTEEAQQVKTETKYVVKEHKGEIAVFVGEDKIPVKILNIDFDGLREYDKQQFKKGLTLNTLYEVLLLEEDFNS